MSPNYVGCTHISDHKKHYHLVRVLDLRIQCSYTRIGAPYIKDVETKRSALADPSLIKH
jgi:hypothetical protein